jgi:3-oxoacyl-[acyl-carrier-protein] synthase-3
VSAPHGPLQLIELGLGVDVLGAARSWPGPPVDNATLLARHPRTAGLARSTLETLSRRIEHRYGVRTRHLARMPGAPAAPAAPAPGCHEETSQSLALQAARTAVAQAECRAAGAPLPAIGALVHGTTTSSRYTGSQAPVILAALDGFAPAYETKAGCSTSLASLHLGFALLTMGYDNVLVSCAETLSKVMNPEARETWFILADGGAAVWLARNDATPQLEVRESLYHTDGRLADLYTTHGALPPDHHTIDAGGYVMAGDGARLAEEARLRYRMMLSAMFPGGAGLERIRWLIPHQINRSLIDAVVRDSGIHAEWIWSADRFGNLGGTSVLFSLAEALENGTFRPGDEILLMSVGGGLSFAMQRWVVRRGLPADLATTRHAVEEIR